jgi:cytochrome c-type biogenesis protein CcmH
VSRSGEEHRRSGRGAGEPSSTVTLRKWLLPLVLLAVIVGALIIGARGDGKPATPQQRADSIASRVKCPVCNGLSVAQSEAGLARSIYAEILRQVEAGRTDQQVTQYIVDTYGEEQLTRPDATGVGSIVWIAPVVLVVLSLAGLAGAFRKWRPAPGGELTDADRALVERAQRVEHAADVLAVEDQA